MVESLRTVVVNLLVVVVVERVSFEGGGARDFQSC